MTMRISGVGVGTSGFGRPLVAEPLRPQPPSWVKTIESKPGFSHIAASVPDAASLGAEALSSAVTTAYRSIVRDLCAAARHPLRIWNFVPQIQAPLGGGDRYMAFNAGRFAAYSEWYGGAGSFSGRLPTASAVGVGGDALWIHILAADAPGAPIENPRQIPSYRYSERYGPRPPCFARATRLGSLLLIGGTASILGEESRHAGDVEAQTRETLANIAAVIAHADGRANGGDGGDALSGLRDLRVHVLRPSDAPRVRAIVAELVPQIAEIELVQADLCRKELLVEIEGRAELEK